VTPKHQTENKTENQQRNVNLGRQNGEKNVLWSGLRSPTKNLRQEQVLNTISTSQQCQLWHPHYSCTSNDGNKSLTQMQWQLTTGPLGLHFGMLPLITLRAFAGHYICSIFSSEYTLVLAILHYLTACPTRCVRDVLEVCYLSHLKNCDVI